MQVKSCVEYYIVYIYINSMVSLLASLLLWHLSCAFFVSWPPSFHRSHPIIWSHTPLASAALARSQTSVSSNRIDPKYPKLNRDTNRDILLEIVWSCLDFLFWGLQDTRYKLSFSHTPSMSCRPKRLCLRTRSLQYGFHHC